MHLAGRVRDPPVPAALPPPVHYTTRIDPSDIEDGRTFDARTFRIDGDHAAGEWTAAGLPERVVVLARVGVRSVFPHPCDDILFALFRVLVLTPRRVISSADEGHDWRVHDRELDWRSLCAVTADW